MIALGGPTLKLMAVRADVGRGIGLNDSTGRAYTETFAPDSQAAQQVKSQ